MVTSVFHGCANSPTTCLLCWDAQSKGQWLCSDFSNQCLVLVARSVEAHNLTLKLEKSAWVKALRCLVYRFCFSWPLESYCGHHGLAPGYAVWKPLVVQSGSCANSQTIHGILPNTMHGCIGNSINNGLKSTERIYRISETKILNSMLVSLLHFFPC